MVTGTVVTVVWRLWLREPTGLYELVPAFGLATLAIVGASLLGRRAQPTREQEVTLRFEHAEMTQLELANRARCARQTIIALEQRRYVPSLALTLRIARAFDRTVQEVFEYVDEA
jgi:putative transcriptional regulator